MVSQPSFTQFSPVSTNEPSHLDPAVDIFSKTLKNNIEHARGQLRVAEKLHGDYSQVINLLESLPNQLKHNIMVPFGSLAFMLGEVTHTNELTVLLGENWFADRTASQTRDIMERRQGYLLEQITSLKSDLLKLGQKIEITDKLFGSHEHEVAEDGTKIVEIKEEFIPEPETPKTIAREMNQVQPLRQKTPKELEEDRVLLEEIRKMCEEEEEKEEEDASEEEELDDEDEMYREGLRYSGRADDDSDFSPTEDEDTEDERTSTSKKQVRFSDSVQEPSVRDPDQFRSNPLWRMMQAARLEDSSEADVPIRKINPSELKLKKPDQTAVQARSSIISETVIENDYSGPFDVDELEMAIDMQVIKDEYQRIKQNHIMSQGGYGLSAYEKDLKELNVYTYDVLDEQDNKTAPKPRKVSRFKAARLAGSKDDEL